MNGKTKKIIQWTAVVLTLAMFAAMKWTPLKKLHPIAFIAAGAAAGILLQQKTKKVASSHGGKRALSYSASSSADRDS